MKPSHLLQEAVPFGEEPSKTNTNKQATEIFSDLLITSNTAEMLNTKNSLESFGVSFLEDVSNQDILLYLLLRLILCAILDHLLPHSLFCFPPAFPMKVSGWLASAFLVFPDPFPLSGSSCDATPSCGLPGSSPVSSYVSVTPSSPLFRVLWLQSIQMVGSSILYLF